MIKLNKPDMKLHFVNTADEGLKPHAFTVEGVIVPFRSAEIRVDAETCGELVLHISLPRIDIIIEEEL